MIGRPLVEWLAAAGFRYTLSRQPDFVIGDDYLHRWWLTPWTGWFIKGEGWRKQVGRILPNAYLHVVINGDDPRALHDHPFDNLSIILAGSYWEILKGGLCKKRSAGDICFRRAETRHRLEVTDGGPVLSLFITGPRRREWGFYTENGWVHWKNYTAENDRGKLAA